jgi:formylglycine-generating enzyme required for sulfatase activity
LTVAVRVRGPSGTQDHSESELPLVLGSGPEAAVALGAADQAAAAAFIGLRGKRFYVQAAPGTTSLAVNDEPLSGASHWLRAGDEIRLGADRLLVEEVGEVLVLACPGEAEPATEPPVLLGGEERTEGATDGETIRPAEFRRSLEALKPAPPTSRRWQTALWIPTLVLVVAAWFVFTAQPVRVVVEPVPESLEIEGGLFTPALGERFLLREGRYVASARLEGYRPLEAPFEVGADGPAEVRFEMERLPDRFTVTSGPVSDARVLVDGEPVGTTPVEDLEIRPGSHVLAVDKPRYRPWEITLEVEGGGNRRSLEAVLEPDWADVTVTSEPPGATVVVDGEEVGVTPLVAQIGAGRVDLGVSMDGFKPWSGRLTVEANVPQVLPPVTLAPADGRLNLASTPPGASVLVDGRYRGQTPLAIDVPPGQAMRVQFRKAGFENASRSVSVASGDTERVSVSLAPIVGVVEFAVTPRDAQIRIDGRVVEPVDGRLELPALEQRVEVSRDGYAPETVAVTPKPGIVQRVAVSLRTVAEVKAASIPRRIVTSQGQELVLVDPGSFTMGSSRREPGRRSNESLREVRITRAFYISTTEVANEWFRKFRAGHDSGVVGGFGLAGPRQPVVSVTWDDAAAFCNWLSEKEGLEPAYRRDGERYLAVEPPTTGYRLPTEAEWAWAARYEGRTGNARRYPWGDAMPPPQGAGNFADESARGPLGVVIAGYNDGFPATAPVGTFGNNALGLKDVGGNVAEWVHDLYGVYPPSQSVATDPRGAASGRFHVIRGSSWMHSGITELRMSFRDYGDKARPDLGFRIARSLE